MVGQIPTTFDHQPTAGCLSSNLRQVLNAISTGFNPRVKPRMEVQTGSARVIRSWVRLSTYYSRARIWMSITKSMNYGTWDWTVVMMTMMRWTMSKVQIKVHPDPVMEAEGRVP